MTLRARERSLAIDARRKYFQDAGNDEEVARIYADTLGPEGNAYLLERITGKVAESNEMLDSSLTEFFGTANFSDKEKTTLKVNSLHNYFRRRHELLANSIGSIEAAEMLDVSKQTIHDRIRDKKLVGLVESNIMRLPVFQFDPAGPSGALAGLRDVVKDFSATLLGKVSWLLSANAVLDGKPPIEVMKHGDLERVLREARSVGVA